MGFLKSVSDWLLMPIESSFEQKGVILSREVNVQPRSEGEIEQALWDREGVDGDLAFALDVVNICARVIAEGLALPQCHLHLEGAKGKTRALKHPLYKLLNLRPNERQSAYQFREQLGYHLALNGNAYVFINRARDGTILELLPCDPGTVSSMVDQSRLFGDITYYLFGQPVPANCIWHLKGPSWLSYEGMNTLQKARNALYLTAATEKFASKLFQNAARPGGILMPPAGTTLTDEQKADIKASWTANNQGVNNAHKTAVLTTGLTFTPLSSTANDAQMIEARKFQVKQICRFFRVSPIKVFGDDGSFAYKSVEQGHIQHDADTDAHWHVRFEQSANINLLTDAERASGLVISLEPQDFSKAPLGEQMAYLTAARAAGLLTQNECRAKMGEDPSDDPNADKLQPAANLFGPPKTPDAATTDEEPKNNG